MNCDYQKLMDKFLDGNLNDDKLKELKEHSLECKSCSDKLMQIELADKIIKNDLLNVPYISSKNSIMEKINKNEFKLRTLSVLYKFRKDICAAAAILVIVASIQFIKPYVNFNNNSPKNNSVTSANTKEATSSNDVTDNSSINSQNTVLSVDVRKLQFTLPANWSVKINSYDVAIFYQNGIKEVGSLLIYNDYPYKDDNELIHNITPNHSETLWSEDISVPLGKGKMAAFKITSPAAAPVQTVEFEIGAIIPISNDQAYETLIRTKDASDSNKKLFMGILNNIKY